MSNYTTENLIAVPPGGVPAGTPAIKIGNQIFPMQVSGTSGMDFYKCAAVSSDISVDTNTYPDSGTDPADGIYRDNGTTMNGYPVYSKAGYWLWYAGDGWIITDIAPGGDTTGHILFGNNGTTDITDWPEPIAATYASSGTWSGYKAVFDSVTNTYRFSSAVTSGLTWTVITPTVGKVYADGALIEAKLWNGIPTDGLIRYAPMSAAASVDELGNTLSVGGSPSFAVDSGIGCAEMTNSYIGYQNAITDLSAYTLSIWMKRLTGGALITFSGGNYGPGGDEIWINYTATGMIGIGNGAAEDADIIITATAYTGWQHIAVVWTGSAFRLYIGGSQYGSDTEAEYGTYGSLWPYINSLQRATGVMGTGKYAAFRLYDRALTAAEIAALAAEFTPSAS